jgi:hypothetical protein
LSYNSLISKITGFDNPEEEIIRQMENLLRLAKDL